MSLDSVATNAHGNLDEEISQLMQCKPLSEQEVTLFLHKKFPFLCFLRCFFFDFFFVGSGAVSGINGVDLVGFLGVEIGDLS
jgi:hypothetical protein